MQMPPALQSAVDALLRDEPPGAVRAAAEALSQRYRQDEKHPAGQRLLRSDGEMRAYCAFRMPATYAALVRAMEMARGSGVQQIRTLTDVGSGTGSALWAAREVFGVSCAALIEREAGMVALAKRLLEGVEDVSASWTQQDMRTADLPPADLVSASFCLGELAQQDALEMVRRLWQAARGALLIVEPGTPAGYARIRSYAALLRELGAHMAAPCPSFADCPIKAEDWCHFTARVERTGLHRYLKDGSLPYEDEKFSFLAVTREPATPAAARIRRRPLVRSGYVELPVCAAQGERILKVTKKHPAYKRARKSQVGDGWEE